MDHYEFYKELYHKENDRRQEVINSMSVPLAVVTALAASIFFLITSFPYGINFPYSVSFIVLMSISSISLLASIFFLGRAFVDFSKAYEYTGVASPGYIYDWHQKLKEYYQEHYANEPGFETMADDQFKKELIGEYIKYTDHNQYVNDQKHARIFISKSCLVVCLTSTILSLIPFAYGFFNKKDDVHKVEIVSSNLKQIQSIEPARNTPAPPFTPAPTSATGPINQRRATAPTSSTIQTPK